MTDFIFTVQISVVSIKFKARAKTITKIDPPELTNLNLNVQVEQTANDLIDFNITKKVTFLIQNKE